MVDSENIKKIEVIIDSINYQINIRRAQAEDAGAICNLRAVMWKTTYRQKEYQLAIAKQEFTSPAMVAHFAQSIQNGKNWAQHSKTSSDIHTVDTEKNTNTQLGPHAHWVATVSGEVVGWAATHQFDNEIIALYLLPKFHGKAIGLALYQILLESLDLAREIIIYAVYGNEYAIKFYEKRGFRIINAPSHAEIVAGLQQDKLPIMKMSLAPKIA